MDIDLLNGVWVKNARLDQGSNGIVRLVEPENSVLNQCQVFALKSCVDKPLCPLRKEYKIVKKFIGHPNIVQCHRQGKEYYHLILEYAPLGNLLNFMDEEYGGNIPGVDVRRYARMLFEGVRDIHARGYVHCDLKPVNILVYRRQSASGYVLKIADFGRGREIEEKITPNLGTPIYMAPESIKLTVASASFDIWSLGCVVLQMITGEPPWDCSHNWIALKSKLEDWTQYPDIPENISDDGKDFLMKCFERNAAERLAADELLRTHPFLLPGY